MVRKQLTAKLRLKAKLYDQLVLDLSGGKSSCELTKGCRAYARLVRTVVAALIDQLEWSTCPSVSSSKLGSANEWLGRIWTDKWLRNHSRRNKLFR